MKEKQRKSSVRKVCGKPGEQGAPEIVFVYFDSIGGASMDGERSKKADVITYALKNAGVKDLSTTVKVGDREYNILGAKAAGLDSIGVLFGYGSRQELESAGATHIAEKVGDILPLI